MADRWYPKDKDELMLAIDRERTALWNLARSLSEREMSAPDAGGWSPKDNLAHLTEWMRSFLGYHLEHRPWHEVLKVDRKLTDNADFDGINELIYQRKRKMAVSDILMEFQDMCSQVYSKLSSLSFEELMQPRFPDDPEKRPVMNWVLSNTSEHFAEHRQIIERAVKAKL